MALAAFCTAGFSFEQFRPPADRKVRKEFSACAWHVLIGLVWLLTRRDGHNLLLDVNWPWRVESVVLRTGVNSL